MKTHAMRPIAGVRIGMLVMAFVLVHAPRHTDAAVQVGDSEKQVIDTYGQPSMTTTRGDDTVLFYRDGEVSIRDGKVSGIQMPEPAKSIKARKPAKPPAPAAEKPVRKDPNAAPIRGRSKPKKGPDSWDAGSIPNFPVLSRTIRRIARQHRVPMSPEALDDAFALAWEQHTNGASSPYRSWKDQVRFRRLEAGTRMEFETDNKEEYTGSIKYERDGKWFYKRELPTAAYDLRECWTKYSTRAHVGRTVSGTQATDHYYGTKSSWYKLTWDLNDKRWYWLPENERETLKKDFRKQVRARLSKTRMQKILKPKSGYTELSQIMRAHSREFEIRAYEAFLKELDTLPWPDA